MNVIKIYSKNFHEIIININYIVSIKKKYHQYGMGEYDVIITMVNGEDLIIPSYHFSKVKEQFKELGVYFET